MEGMEWERHDRYAHCCRLNPLHSILVFPAESGIRLSNAAQRAWSSYCVMGGYTLGGMSISNFSLSVVALVDRQTMRRLGSRLPWNKNVNSLFTHVQ